MAKRWILRAGLWALLGVAVFIVIVGGFGLSLHHKFNPSPPAFDFPAPADALAAQEQDIEQFSRLLGMDRSFSPTARAEANRQIAALRGERAPLDRARFRVALMRIAALADNGHTELSDRDDAPNLVPLRLTLFADGLYVLRAKSPVTDLLGARVERIEGRPSAEVIAALEQLQGGTQGWRLLHATIYVQSPEVLFGDGIAPQADRTTWTLLLPDGSEVTRTLPGENFSEHDPHGMMTRWLSPEKEKGEDPSWQALFSSDDDAPLSLREFNTAFRRAWVNQGCTLFIQLKSITDAGGEHIGEFLKSTTAEMREHAPCNVILDLRFNTGGDYTKAASFASHLVDSIAPGGRIYILIGPQTFSAAITTVAFVKQAAKSRAIIVGESVGDRLAFYAEGNRGCLPHAAFCLHYATGMHDYGHRCRDWDKCFWLNWLYPVQVQSLAPDETIAMTYADFTARRDPVYDRAVTLAAARK